MRISVTAPSRNVLSYDGAGPVTSLEKSKRIVAPPLRRASFSPGLVSDVSSSLPVSCTREKESEGTGEVLVPSVTEISLTQDFCLSLPLSMEIWQGSRYGGLVMPPLGAPS